MDTMAEYYYSFLTIYCIFFSYQQFLANYEVHLQSWICHMGKCLILVNLPADSVITLPRLQWKTNTSSELLLSQVLYVWPQLWDQSLSVMECQLRLNSPLPGTSAATGETAAYGPEGIPSHSSFMMTSVCVHKKKSDKNTITERLCPKAL